MTNIQKVIKYLAIAFAIFLIYNILSAIVFGISSITRIFENDYHHQEEKLTDVTTFNDINILNIDISTSKLTIKNGDSFKAETNNENITINQEGNKLYIKEKEHHWFTKNNQEIVVYLPNNIELDILNVDAGAGNIIIEDLTSKTIYFNLGAGSTEINKLTVLNNIDISAGVGDIKILDSTLRNFNLDAGVGDIKIIGDIKGNSEINLGIGNLDLNLTNSVDNYQIDLSKGLGSIKVNNETIKNNQTYGTGENFIEIDGAIGNIDIKTD